MTEITKFAYVLSMFIILNRPDMILSAKNITTQDTPSHYIINVADSSTGTPTKLTGKWQVGRVSRKHYEIINMLYRKTNKFVESENTSAVNSIRLSKYRGTFNKVTLPIDQTMQEPLQTVHPRSKGRPLTPSYIEFYYLDESDDRVKRKHWIPKTRTDDTSDEHKITMIRSPFFLFRLKDATCKHTTLNNMLPSFHDTKHFSSDNIETSTTKHKGKSTKYNKNMSIQHKYATSTLNKIHNMKNKTNITENKKFSFSLRDRGTTLSPRTSYDRIKFFDIYDSGTYKPRILVDNKININNNNNIQHEEKISLDQVNHNTSNHDGNNITRHVRMYANYSFDNKDERLNFQFDNIRKNISTIVQETRNFLTKFSQPAAWSDYPFIAVYIYEPLLVRCDAAAISPHWLVTTAVCLHRHLKNPESNTEGRSAFVAYCGGNWRLPGRIAYVKRSFIHPRYQAKHTSRRYLYNIGVVQVVNSMANSCSGWLPVSLMSHKFSTKSEGSYATAVGWGLNRYYMRHASSDLPTQLMMYEGLVYSDSCPGNTDYSKVKMLNEDNVKNVYCLSLPTYTLEENDCVHGGILLIGEKLIALYLQEERRPWGVQSAQYTGVWRHIPWLLDVAREAEDPMEAFVFDI